MSLLGDSEDVGSAVFEVGKAAKGLISNADKLAGGLRGLGDLFQRFSTVGRLSDIARLGRKLSAYGDDALRFLANPEITRFLKRAKTPILFGGQLTIAGMKLTTGFGDPDDGGRFGEGANRFRQVGDTLAGAHPNGSWTGSGSESYSSQNSRQVGRTQTLAAQDQSINAVLAREAGQITATRTVLDEQSDWLADVGLVTMLVAATPFVGQGASLAMEIAAVTKALGACTMQLTELTQQVNGNAAEIHQSAGRYGEVPDMSQLPGTPQSTVPTSPASSGGGLGSLASPLSSLPAASAGMSAAQIASLVQSAVQKAMQDQAEKDEREEAERATEDTDGDGIPDVAGAAPSAQEGGRAPVHLAVDVDPAQETGPIAATLDRNDPNGSPWLPQQ